ncbi:MAG: flavin reductase [Bacteroidales bacterium]|nr:flavin reductase [Bacteroidales bacterium]
MQNTKKNFDKQAVITPLPVLIIATYDANGNPDAMNAAWGGQCGPKHIVFELSAHQTTENIRLKKAFTVSFADKKHVTESDYFGVVSAKKEPNKIKKAGMSVTKSSFVDAPVINEYPLTVECKVITFDEDGRGGARVVGEIVNMQADESILDENGNIDLGKMEPIMYDSSKHYYRVIGEKVGNAFSDGKKIK